ncbi:MAG: TonB-dependent receptor [Clostridiales bacterium]|nr:TonB-dependent receptor [Clostridiales bacterium]
MAYASPVAMASSAAEPAPEAQQLSTIHGTVVDTTGEPLTGATVKVVGTDVAVAADFDGNFAIKAKPGATLEVTYIGFKPQQVKAADGMTITMKEDELVLNEVEVVAYGVQKKVTMTGAVSSIKNEDLMRTPVSSVTNVLSGQLSGVSTVQYSGEPGSDAAEIFVRGKATWGDAKPLIQVDGVERDMWDIDPNEIESISVLKDASATAVFGVRGANGVILVTTKRGAEGKAKIDVSLNFSAQMPTKLIEMANSIDYANFYNYTRNSDGEANEFTPQVIEKFSSNRLEDQIRFPNRSWTDEIFKKVTFQQQHNVNISGGNKKVRYFVSAGFFSQDGIFKQYGYNDYPFDYRYNRFNYRSNLDINVTPTTQVSVNVAGKVDNSAKPQTGQGAEGMIKAIYGATPFSAYGFDSQGRYIYPNSDPTYNMEFNGTNLDEDGNDLGTPVYLPFVGSAPMTYITYNRGAYHNTANTMNTDVILTQKLDVITKNLQFRIKGSYNSGFGQQKTISSQIDMLTPVLQKDGTLKYINTAFADDAHYSEKADMTSKWRNWYFETAFDWNRRFDKHSFSALALYNQSKEFYPKSYSDIARGYVGFVGRVTYDFDSRYLAEVNFGFNGSENFAPKKRFGSFPAASIGWVVTNEKFMQPLYPVLSFLKFRVTVGKVGNDKIGGNRFMYTADPYGVNSTGMFCRDGYGYPFGVGDALAFQPGAWLISKNNPDVTWENSVKQNYAVDAQFLNNRLKTSFDYYREHRTNILLQNFRASGLLGYDVPFTNDGIVDSWGWELSIGWNDQINKDFSYFARLNLSFNDNKIIRDGQAPQSYEYMETAGKRIGSRSQLKFWRYYDENSVADYEKEFGSPFPQQLKPNDKLNYGDPIYVDLNKDGKIDGNDYSREFGKTDDPRYIAGLVLGFTYKGFSFSTQFTGAFEVTRSLSGAFQTPFWNAGGDNKGGLLKIHLDNSWSEDNRNATYPRPTFSYKDHTYAGSTLWEKDASYIRCKSMQLAYNFNMPWMKKLGLTMFQVSVSGYNLFTFSKYDWGDPENRASSSPTYPLTRTVTGGIKVAF